MAEIPMSVKRRIQFADAENHRLRALLAEVYKSRCKPLDFGLVYRIGIALGMGTEHADSAESNGNEGAT